MPIDTTTAPTTGTVANGGGASAGDMGTLPAPPTNAKAYIVMSQLGVGYPTSW